MINQAILLGRVGNKDTKQLKNNTNVTILSIATSRKYKDSTGQAKELTTWHNVSCFAKLSEIASKYVNVGDMVFVQGEIHNKKIETGERAGQFVYSLHASDIKFIPKGKSESKPAAKVTNEFEDDECPF